MRKSPEDVRRSRFKSSLISKQKTDWGRSLLPRDLNFFNSKVRIIPPTLLTPHSFYEEANTILVGKHLEKRVYSI